MKSIQALVGERNSRLRDQSVLRVMISRAPNALRVDHLARIMPEYTTEEIAAALDSLQAAGEVKRHDHPNEKVPGRILTSYLLRNSDSLPVKETISIGGVEYTRILSGDITNAEDLNAAVEAIAQYDALLEKRIGELAAKMTRRYWANIGALFALFVAMFALIIRGTDPVVIQGHHQLRDLVILRAAGMIPLAIVLLGFAVLMWLLMRRI